MHVCIEDEGNYGQYLGSVFESGGAAAHGSITRYKPMLTYSIQLKLLVGRCTMDDHQKRDVDLKGRVKTLPIRHGCSVGCKLAPTNRQKWP